MLKLTIEGNTVGELFDNIQRVLDEWIGDAQVHGAGLPDTSTDLKPVQSVKPEAPAQVLDIPQPTASELDVAGTPWDARIHTGTKSKNADGTWRKKRGVSNELYNKVIAEITSAAPPPPPAQTIDVPVPTNLDKDYADIMELVAIKGIDFGDIYNACAQVGVGSLLELKTQPDLQPVVYDILNNV